MKNSALSRYFVCATELVLGLSAASSSAATLTVLNTNASGVDQLHANVMPSLTANFGIAMQGLFPPQRCA